MLKIILVEVAIMAPLVRSIVSSLSLTKGIDIAPEALVISIKDINLHLDAILLGTQDDDVEPSVIENCVDVLGGVVDVLVTRMEIDLHRVYSITYHPRYHAVAFHMEIP